MNLYLFKSRVSQKNIHPFVFSLKIIKTPRELTQSPSNFDEVFSIYFGPNGLSLQRLV